LDCVAHKKSELDARNKKEFIDKLNDEINKTDAKTN